MFDGRYIEWNQKRIKLIIDFYGYQFMVNKTVLDLGCGHADISGALYRLGADITALDARPEHLKIASKKFPGIKTVKADLDQNWPFPDKQFDIILDLGLLCHLRNYESHLRTVCGSTTYLVLETAVCNSVDPNTCISMPENKAIYDLSANGMGSRPTSAAIERVLSECGMDFKRMDTSKLNCEDDVYDWNTTNSGNTSIHNRRLWFAVKNNDIHLSSSFTSHTPQQSIKNTANNLILPPSITPPPPPIYYNPLPVNINSYSTLGDKNFVVVIPSYKNEKWCIQNIQSVLNQNYDKFRIIFTDDCSPDGTFEKVKSYIDTAVNGNKVTLIKNTNRIGALANLYNMIHSCDDYEIILTLDGDDWFPDNNVLNRLNDVYSDDNVWMTYGQYKNSNDGGRGVASPYPDHVINANSFRTYSWGASHLRTFYAWLFKKIRREDLSYNGGFFPMTWDFAMMFPMLEMSGFHSKFLSDILYVYNLDNPINDHKVNMGLQQDLDRKIRSMPSYPRVVPPEKKTNIGILLIATAKYTKFVQGFISSADNYFLKSPLYNVTYYVFTDQQINIQSRRNIVYIPIVHKPFPFASMDRFRHFTNNTDKLSNESYLYYLDVDSIFVDNVSDEIIGDLVGVQHCGYIKKVGPYENNVNSVLYVNEEYPRKYKCYFGGGFSGGRKSNYLNLARWCADMIDTDVSHGIIPIWHDETALNRYFLDNEPSVVLTPSYHYPQSNIDYYKSIWFPQDFRPKILLLDKNHGEVRT